MSTPNRISESEIVINHFGGLNERKRFANDEAGEFDFLEGLIQQTDGVIQRPNGIGYLLNIGTNKILSIHQTFDDRQNVIVQTDNGVYVMSEAEFMSRVPATNLTPVTLLEEEDMSQAILVNAVAAGTNGGTYTTTDTWQTAPLTGILSQVNPDGTAAAFCTFLGFNQFRLIAGKYRFRGWSLMSQVNANRRSVARLFNVTAGAAAWVGLDNEEGNVDVGAAADRNSMSWFGGYLSLGGNTDFEIQGKQHGAQTNTGFGAPMNTGGTFGLVKEIYRWLEILKTG